MAVLKINQSVFVVFAVSLLLKLMSQASPGALLAEVCSFVTVRDH